jgi:glycosyltransferase
VRLAVVRRLFPGALLDKFDYSKIIDNFYSPSDRRDDVYPQLLAGWDRSPRSGRKAIIYYNNTPETFEKAAKKAVECVEDKAPEHRIVFLNSWNEWGEGAYMEPDLKYGKGKIQVLHKILE